MKSQDEAMLKVIHDALDFCNWAAGQGFCNEAGKPGPDELLCVYANAIEVGDFDEIPGLVRNTVANLLTLAARPL